MARTLLGWCAAVYLAFGVGLAEFAFRPPHPSTLLEKAQAAGVRLGAKVEDASIVSRDGLQLQAWFVPSEKANGDAVILLHGIGDDRRGMSGFAVMLRSAGYNVLMPDSRGHGASGGFTTYGIREVEDLQLWNEWLVSRCHPRCVFGMGESLGAAIVLQASGRVPFCAVVAESPFASFREIGYLRVGQFFGAGSWMGRIVLRPAVEFAFLYGWLTRGVNLSAASPEWSVGGTHVPILLLHGLADTNIPHEQSEKIRARNPGFIELWEVPNAEHVGASAVAPLEFRKRVLDWFATHRAETPHLVIVSSVPRGTQ